MPIKRKLNVKSLGEKCQALKDLESLIMFLRKFLTMPLPRKGNGIRDLYQRFESLYVPHVTNARKQSILTFLEENKNQ